jgi:hypothetical protein
MIGAPMRRMTSHRGYSIVSVAVCPRSSDSLCCFAEIPRLLKVFGCLLRFIHHFESLSVHTRGPCQQVSCVVSPALSNENLMSSPQGRTEIRIRSARRTWWMYLPGLFCIPLVQEQDFTCFVHRVGHQHVILAKSRSVDLERGQVGRKSFVHFPSCNVCISQRIPGVSCLRVFLNSCSEKTFGTFKISLA